MLVSHRAALAAMLLLAAVLGCGHGPTQPLVTNIQMSLSAAPSVGSSASPITFTFSVKNVGQTQVWYCAGCGCGTGVNITVLGPDGKKVLRFDPKAPAPDCPDDNVSLLPRQALFSGDPYFKASTAFTGTLYVADSPVYPTPTYAAPEGRYTVIASFGYRTASSWSAPGFGIERRATFDWRP